MKNIQIFLASSKELKTDREQFEKFIYRRSKQWKDRSIFFELIIWEDFIDAVSQTRLQDEYNKAIKRCDIFVMLFYTKVGKYTEEEFETAFGQFKEMNKPFIFTYFKEDTETVKKEESLQAFQQKLSELGHFYTKYKNTEDLLLQFSNQLEKLYAVEFKKMEAQTVQMNQQAGKIYNIDRIDNASFS